MRVNTIYQLFKYDRSDRQVSGFRWLFVAEGIFISFERIFVLLRWLANEVMN